MEKSSLFVLIMIFASLVFAGCTVKTQDTTMDPVTIETPDVDQQQATEQVQTQEQTQTKEQTKLEGAKQFCGDNVCENIESLYPSDELVCDVMKCSIGKMYTENSYICPGDCGLKCDESVNIGFAPGSCKITEDGINVNVKNSGRGNITGLLFYIASSREGDVTTQIGYDTSDASIESGVTKEIRISLTEWKEKFGTVHHVQIVPRQNVDGQIKECSNKKVYIPLTSCRQ